jgi:hypothetical protein
MISRLSGLHPRALCDARSFRKCEKGRRPSVVAIRAVAATRGQIAPHRPSPSAFDPFSPAAVYIGKAVGETIALQLMGPLRIYSSCPHLWPNKPYLISCAEEYLLHKYAVRHGEKPRANTK